ncbi:MAG: endonuclease/exonuclease/phosphatase family protein, partial [Candidatus Omnitrophica bacterium]|nr:endonuclease/exonuclease/phosphatase family protein [Candidatus Omnitrophota bacterium]
MKLFSWNVNGIRAIEKKGFVEWLNKAGPDILAIQETKVQETQLTDSLLKIKGYFSYWHCAQHKGYSGVGLYIKEEPTIRRGWGVKR